MNAPAKDQATALAHINALKITQRDVLVALNAQAHAARKAGNAAKARALSQSAITLSQKNLVIHRAKQKALRVHDLGQINAKLKAIAAQSEQIRKDLNGIVDALTKAAKFIDLLRRAIDVLNK